MTQVEKTYRGSAPDCGFTLAFLAEMSQVQTVVKPSQKGEDATQQSSLVEEGTATALIAGVIAKPRQRAPVAAHGVAKGQSRFSGAPYSTGRAAASVPGLVQFTGRYI